MDRTLFANQFLSLIDREGYTFVHEVRCDGSIVCVLPYRTTDTGREYLARRETCPAHASINEQPELCCITGGVDLGNSPLVAAQIELAQETGYRAKLADFDYLGAVKPSKAMDTVAHLFAVDVSSLPAQSIEGDGSELEAAASVEWLGEREGFDIQDSLFISVLARLTKQSSVI